VNGAALPISKNVQAFQFALDIDAAVVSNSWGFVDPLPVPKELADAINQVFDHGRGGKGAPVVFAVGNDGRTVGTNELLGVRGVLGVGAINNFDESTPFTNSGDVVDIVAPTGTLTTDITGAAGEDPSDYTSLFGGTSSACPVVAGIMGLLVGAAPDKTAQELYDIVIQTTRDAPFAVPDSKGHDPTYGYGIVDPVAALDVALGLSTGAGGAGGAGGGKSSSKPAPSDGCSCALANGDSGEPLAALLGISALGVAFARRRRLS
jgi:MYXO-CTERM domain-containing protein